MICAPEGLARYVAAAALVAAVPIAPGAGEEHAATPPLAAFEVVGDAIPAPLDGLTGVPDRGQAIVLDRRSGNCLICHLVPVAGEPFQGELGPDLAGVGGRLTAGQIRLRLVDQSRLNADTLMPSYYRVDGLTNVEACHAGRPVLSAQEIEDVVAYLMTLRE